MRKLSKERKEWLIRQQRIIAEQQRRNKKHFQNQGGGSPHLMAPVNFCLYDRKAFDITTKFINRVEKFSSISKRTIILNFKNTEIVTAAAVLCLHATISMLKRINKDLKIRAINIGNVQNGDYLKCSGFMREDMEITDNDVIIPQVLPIRTGLSHDGGESVEKVVNEMDKIFYSGELDEDLARKNYIHQAINEAILNVTQHAYEDHDDEFLQQVGDRWWVLGQQVNDQITIAFYDKGSGIPVTLPKHELWETIRMAVRKYLKQGHDSAMIQAATELNRSKHGGSGRGSGLSDIIAFATNNPNGILRIYSNKGLYLYDRSFDTDPGHQTKLYEHKNSIRGTLIQWSISLEEEGIVKH